MGYLEAMIDRRRASVKEFVKGFSGERLKSRLDKVREPRRVLQALAAGDEVLVIPELRRADPVHGSIAPYEDAGEAAEAFERGGAAMASCWTEPDDFGGSFDDLGAMADASGLPTIARDMVVTSEQLALFRAFGADAAVIIAGQVGDKLESFVKLCIHMGLTPIVEAHGAQELVDAAAVGAPCVLVEAIGGIGDAGASDVADNGDVDESGRSAHVDRELTLKLARAAKRAGMLVIVGGIVEGRADVAEAAASGADAVIAPQVMRAGDLEKAVAELVGVERRPDPHRTSVEVAGVTSMAEAKRAEAAGARAVGVFLDPDHPRHISAKEAAIIFGELDDDVRRVGIYGDLDPDRARRDIDVAGLDSVQVEGSATMDALVGLGRPVIRGIRLAADGSFDEQAVAELGAPVVSVLLRGDVGQDWSKASVPGDWPVIVAGEAGKGLGKDEAAAAVRTLAPAAVVMELVGPDDAHHVKEFVSAVRAADDAINDAASAAAATRAREAREQATDTGTR